MRAEELLASWHLSPSLTRALASARTEAAASRHAFVGAEHLLAGLLGDRGGAAAALFARAGLDAELTRTSLTSGMRVRERQDGDPAEPPPFSQFAERILQGAGREARQASRETIEE